MLIMYNHGLNFKIRTLMVKGCSLVLSKSINGGITLN